MTIWSILFGLLTCLEHLSWMWIFYHKIRSSIDQGVSLETFRSHTVKSIHDKIIIVITWGLPITWTVIKDKKAQWCYFTEVMSFQNFSPGWNTSGVRYRYILGTHKSLWDSRFPIPDQTCSIQPTGTHKSIWEGSKVLKSWTPSSSISKLYR